MVSGAAFVHTVFSDLLGSFFFFFFVRGMQTRDSLGFCLPEVFISPSLLKGRFQVYRILAWCGFSLNTVTISVYSLLTCMVSEDKSDVIFIFALL